MWTISHAEYATMDKNTFEVMHINPHNDTGVIRMHRKLPVESYDDKDLLTVSQGPKGRWV